MKKKKEQKKTCVHLDYETSNATRNQAKALIVYYQQNACSILIQKFTENIFVSWLNRSQTIAIFFRVLFCLQLYAAGTNNNFRQLCT